MKHIGFKQSHFAVIILLAAVSMITCTRINGDEANTPRQTDTIYVYTTRTDTIWVHDTITPSPVRVEEVTVYL